MAETPRRFKHDDELTTDEILRVQQAEKRGEPTPRFETDAHRKARADALRAAGLDDAADELDDDDDGPADFEAMTTEQIDAHLRADR